MGGARWGSWGLRGVSALPRPPPRPRRGALPQFPPRRPSPRGLPPGSARRPGEGAPRACVWPRGRVPGALDLVGGDWGEAAAVVPPPPRSRAAHSCLRGPPVASASPGLAPDGHFPWATEVEGRGAEPGTRPEPAAGWAFCGASLGGRDGGCVRITGVTGVESEGRGRPGSWRGAARGPRPPPSPGCPPGSVVPNKETARRAASPRFLAHADQWPRISSSHVPAAG